MIDKVTIVRVYNNYLKEISEGEGERIPVNFKKLIEFIDSKCEDDELGYTIKVDAIYQTIKTIKKRNVILRSVTENWNKNGIKDVKRLISLVCESHDKLGTDESYKVNLYKLFKTIKDEKDTCSQLYMLLCHMDSIDGKKFYAHKSSEAIDLILAKSDEEINAILKKHYND